MRGKIDYWSIQIPDKPRSEFTYAERRAELLKKAAELGHPDLLKKKELAAEYGVSPAQISHDLNVLAEYISRNLGKDSDFIAEMVYKKGVKASMAEEDYDKARRHIESWQQWLFARGAVSKEPEKMKIDSTERIVVNIQGVSKSSPSEAG
jgi:hypothetical protein